MKTEKKTLNLDEFTGAYDNFFHVPGSHKSLQVHLDMGWKVTFIQDDKEKKEAMVVLEREVKSEV